MSAPAWTPGPWRMHDGKGYTEIHARDGQEYNADVGATVYCTSLTPFAEERMANAQLITAAPDLADAADKALACLRHTHDRLIEYSEFVTLRHTINAECRSLSVALAKARGEQP